MRGGEDVCSIEQDRCKFGKAEDIHYLYITTSCSYDTTRLSVHCQRQILEEDVVFE